MENTNYENNVIHEDVIRRVKEQMPQEEPIYEVSELFRVFGDSSRSRIICALHIEEMCVNDLAVLLTSFVSCGTPGWSKAASREGSSTIP